MGRLSKRVINQVKKTESKKKRQTMKKKLFKTRLLSFATFCGFALAFASCANEDVAQGAGTDNENDKNLTTFVAGDEAKTRTSMDYTSGNFFWEAGDHIYVKDDNKVWRKSSNAPTGKVASFKFKVPGKFTESDSYKVYYPGKNGSNDQVTIPATQSQSEPNSTAHFGVSGDCGTATAKGTVGGGSFSFALDHQAAILVLQPYVGNPVLNNGCYLTKVEITSDNNITGTYTLDPSSGELTGTGTGKEINIKTIGSGAYTNGFSLTNAVSATTADKIYVHVMPGTHKLKVRYWVKSLIDNIEGTITKILPSFAYAKNTYYDMTANLNPENYDGDHYYMWDAQQQYWYGYEWTKNLAGNTDQPTQNNRSSSNYPKSKDDSRYYNDGSGSPFNATRTSCKDLPNVNQMTWYAKEGDPRWDAHELWTTMGHLYKGGMWFKKNAQISGYKSNTAVDNTDWRTTGKDQNWSPSRNLPSAADADKYFYLPALGCYLSGQLLNVGKTGDYWSSSAQPSSSGNAFSLNFDSVHVYVHINDRLNGYRVGVFK